MPTALITLGRLPKALTLARLIKRAGYRVIVAEPFGWHICRVSNAVARSYKTPPPNADAHAYRAALLDIIDKEQVSLIVPVSEEIHHVLPLRQRLRDDIKLLGPDWQDYQTCADKLRFAERAQDLGLRTPPTFALHTEQARKLADREPCIYKPRRGCSGLGITRDMKLAQQADTAGGVIAQQFIPGQVISSLSWVDRDQAVKTVVYEGKAYAGSVSICFEQIQPSQEVTDWIDTWVRSFNLEGFLALDLIIDDAGQPWGIECNPRLTSGIHFFDDMASLLSRGVSIKQPCSPTKPNKARRWQWAYSTLTEAYAELFKGRPRAFLKNLRWLFTTRDCVWSWRDPLPFLMMTPLSAPILWPAMSEGISMGEACQRDIAPLWDADIRSEATGAESARRAPVAQTQSARTHSESGVQ
ncbi:MAG: ATP-grasp domain-containing protein [Halieaceae bacterium]|jgi:predicted ATP-grasp superfamily ATP-dependent carboligase|nr:ATP-grasp domain-containing protein [Halieaceae bacterium]